MEREEKKHRSLHERTLQATGSGFVSRPETDEIARRGELASRRRKADREFRISQSVIAQQNRERGLTLSQLVIYFIAAAAILSAALIIVLGESSLHTRMSMVNANRIACEHLTEENRDLEAEISARVNVAEIRRIAQQRGLKDPTGNQVIVYRKTESEQVIQNEEIPRK